MEITKCTLDDLDKLDEFYDKIVYDLTQNVNWPMWMYKVYPCRQTIARQITLGTQYKCTCGGVIVGAFVLTYDVEHEFDIVKTWQTSGNYMVIHTLATADGYRNCGVATQMVDFCKQTCIKNNCSSLRLDVVPTNAPAKKLYEKLGFAYRGDYDLLRGYEHIPLFSVYEYVL